MPPFAIPPNPIGPVGAAPVAPRNPNIEDQFVHTVAEGDTVDALAKRFNVMPHSIEIQNDLADPNGLQVGQQLRIPRLGTYTVAPGDSLFKIANALTYDFGKPGFKVSISDLVKLNNIENPDLIYPGQRLAFHFPPEV